MAALFRTTTAADGSFVLKGIPQGVADRGDDRGPGVRLAEDLLEHDPGGDDRARQPPGTDQGPAQAARRARALGSTAVYARSHGTAGQGRPRARLDCATTRDIDGRQGRLVPVRRPAAGPVRGRRLLRAGRRLRRRKPVERGRGRPERRRHGRDPARAARDRSPAGSSTPGPARASPDIPVACYRIENMYLKDHARRPRPMPKGDTRSWRSRGRSRSSRGTAEDLSRLRVAAECPNLEVKADQAWPDLKLAPRPSSTASSSTNPAIRSPGPRSTPARAGPPGSPRREEPIRTGPDGTFHLDQLDPDDKLSLWARAGDATTDGTIVVRPSEVKGKLTLTVDPKYAVRIRGLVTDSSGQRIAGAKVTLWWNRPYATEKSRDDGHVGSVACWRRTRPARTAGSSSGASGRSVTYNVVVEARGHNKAEAPRADRQGRRDPRRRQDRADQHRRPPRRPGRRLRRPADRRRGRVQPRRRPRAGRDLHRSPGPVPARRAVPGDQVCLRPQGGISIHRRQGRRRRRRPDHHAAQDHGAAPGVEAGHDRELRGAACLRQAGPDPALGEVRRRMRTTTARSRASGPWPRSIRTSPCSGRPRRAIGTTTTSDSPRPGSWPRPTPTARWRC